MSKVFVSILLLSLLATPAYALSLRLTWTDTSNNEDGFNIERRTDPIGSYGAKIGSTGPDIATYTDTTITAGQRYCYRVQAFNTGGVSNYSNEACATPVVLPPPPSAPSNLGITVIP